MTLLAMICPACAAPLGAAADRRILVCDACRRSWTPAASGERLVETTRELVRPRHRPPAGAEVVLLPVWTVELDASHRAGVPASLPSQLRIPAVGFSRLPLLMQFARNLSRAPLVVEPWTGVEIAVADAELSADDAFELAEMVALRCVPGWPRDEEIESLELPLVRARLCDWPCARFGSEIVELVGGLAVPRAIVDESALTDRAAELSAAMDTIHAEPLG